MTYNPDVHYMTLDATRSAASTVKPNTPAARKGGISEVATLSELRRSEKRGIQENQSSANPGQVKAPCSKQEGGDATKGDAWTPPFEMRQPIAVNETEAQNPVAAKGYSWADGVIRESVARSDGRDIFVHVTNSR